MYFHFIFCVVILGYIWLFWVRSFRSENCERKMRSCFLERSSDFKNPLSSLSLPSDSKELQSWIDTLNFVAALLSAQPLPGGIGSQKKFQRPLLPSSHTRLNPVSRQNLPYFSNQYTFGIEVVED